MKILRRIIKWLSFLILIVLAGLISMIYIFDAPMNLESLVTEFEELGLPAPIAKNLQTSSGRMVTYLDTHKEAADDYEATLLFVHGAPGSAEHFSAFMQDPSLRERFRMIAVDRPGYGREDYGQVMTSITDQAKHILEVLYHEVPEEQPTYLLSHSYGGPIILSMAGLEQERVSGVISFAGVISPEDEVIFFFNPILHWKPLRSILPTTIRLSNTEKMTHADELQKQLAIWRDIVQPVVIIHGEKDWIAPPVNADFAEEFFREQLGEELSVLRFPDESHFFPGSGLEIIIPEIHRMVGE